ncbi:MAG: hypothetical protein OXE02_11100 [Chloroflexi bacterium]|nr:hypothetical protein [Chloroflexota bacterium]
MDGDGDPIHVIVDPDGDRFRIDDTSTIAGHLFTLGQHTLNTPAFKLLRDVAESYGAELDYNRGTVILNAGGDRLLDSVMDLAKVIVTMVTATPFIRVDPNRIRHRGGSRLRTRIKREYESRNIMALVEDSYELRGTSGASWPVDFHWWTDKPAEEPLSVAQQHVYVVTANLDVQEPMTKANHLATLALDAQRQSPADNLRVVVEHSRSRGREALSLLRTHSERLAFQVYDFDVTDERESFVAQSVKEITENSQTWQQFWLEKTSRTFGFN